MSEQRITTSVRARNNFGRFISKMELAKIVSLEEVSERGEAAAKALAPHGEARSDYGRRPKLVENIKSHVMGNFAVWSITAINALSQETGAAPHPITGNPDLVFYWKSRGRRVRTPQVMHPGNRALHYMKTSFEIMNGEVEGIIRKYYS